MRIISGTLKGRKLKAPDWDGLRPTSDKLRETLFNVLGPRVQGARFVDAYAGTGAVGIEALSRGAAHVTFVERDPRAQRLIVENLEHSGITERYAIIRGAFTGNLAAQTVAVDILFLDPPYGGEEMTAALDAAQSMTSDGTRVVLEHARRDQAPAQIGRLVLTRDLISGDSGLAFYKMA
jgi:16S rRNA (guanine966-N2)-methyltransferase